MNVGDITIVGFAVVALVCFLSGLVLFVREHIVDVDDPEDRWAREAGR